MRRADLECVLINGRGTHYSSLSLSLQAGKDAAHCAFPEKICVSFVREIEGRRGWKFSPKKRKRDWILRSSDLLVPRTVFKGEKEGCLTSLTFWGDLPNRKRKKNWNKGESAAVSNELGASEIPKIFGFSPLPFSPWGQIGPQLWTLGTMSALGSMRKKNISSKGKKDPLDVYHFCLYIVDFFFLGGGSRVGVYQEKGGKSTFSTKTAIKN